MGNTMQGMSPPRGKRRELVLLALLSAFMLCGVALIYAEPIATAVFAALTSGCVVIAAVLSRGSWT
jgi:hypothetical protein